ncbi:MAG: aminoacyl-tRNA hydrolase [Candidatus Puniceispirillum sp.]
MLVFVGLGNPGTEYAFQRHNAGFMAVDRIADQHGFSPWKKKNLSLMSEGRIGTEKVILLKPQSFMNRSGLPVAECIKFYKVEPASVFVFHDELDLGIGRIKVKIGGGHGGHNGLRDIDRHLGQNYWRVRVGVGRPPVAAMDVRNWVLTDFSKEEQSGWLGRMLDAIADEAGRLVDGDDGGFMSRVAYLAAPPDSQNGKGKPNKATPKTDIKPDDSANK